MIPGYKTSLSATFVARSGRPYSLTFTGNNVFNSTNGGLTTNDAALAYIPSGATDPNVVFVDTLNSNGTVAVSAAQNAAKYDTFISGLACANKYRGMSIPRNTCENDWYYDMDLTIAQELPGKASVSPTTRSGFSPPSTTSSTCSTAAGTSSVAATSSACRTWRCWAATP